MTSLQHCNSSDTFTLKHISTASDQPTTVVISDQLKLKIELRTGARRKVILDWTLFVFKLTSDGRLSYYTLSSSTETDELELVEEIMLKDIARAQLKPFVIPAETDPEKLATDGKNKESKRQDKIDANTVLILKTSDRDYYLVANEKSVINSWAFYVQSIVVSNIRRQASAASAYAASRHFRSPQRSELGRRKSQYFEQFSSHDLYKRFEFDDELTEEPNEMLRADNMSSRRSR